MSLRRPTISRFGFSGFLPLLLTFIFALVMLLPIGSGVANVTMPHLVMISVFYWVGMRPLMMPYGACALIGLMLDLWLDVPLGLNILMLLLTRLFVLNQLKHYRGKSRMLQWGVFALMALVLYALAWLIMSMAAREFWTVLPLITQWLVTTFAYAPMVLLLGRVQRSAM